jgi:hypothetical protein
MTDEPDVRYEVSDIRLRYQTINSASIFSNPKTLNPRIAKSGILKRHLTAINQ